MDNFENRLGVLSSSIKVRFYAPRSSTAVDAELSALGSERIRVLIPDVEAFEYATEEFKILPPIGRTPRRIRFANGAQCTIVEGQEDAFAQFQAIFGNRGMQRYIHKLEGSLKWIIAFTVFTILFVFGAYKYGLPAVAHHLAMQSPQNLRVTVSDSSMELIDEHMMRPTDLAVEDIGVLEILMEQVKEHFDEELNLQLEVRSSRIGPNAFALPDGRIIFTDELYELLEMDDQMLAVLAHEAGHVEEQHGLRLVIQNTGLALAISLMLGDVSSWGGLASALPTLLAQGAYSRKFETEADLTAAKFLAARGLGVEPMRQALILLHEGHEEVPAEDLFSTHPSLKKRLEALDSFAPSGD